MLLFTFDPNRDLTFHPLISSNLLWRKRRLVSHLIVSGKFPLSLSFSLIIDLLSPLHSKATTRLFPGPIVIYIYVYSFLFSFSTSLSIFSLAHPSLLALASPSVNSPELLLTFVTPLSKKVGAFIYLSQSAEYTGNYVMHHTLSTYYYFMKPSLAPSKVMDVFIKAAEYMGVLICINDNEPLQKLFMLVRSELNLDLKNIKQEQANFWKQHLALVKMELLIQAHLNHESASLSPSLHVDFTHVLELAQRLYFFFLLTTNQCPKWRIYVASSTTIVVALLVISIKNTDGGDKWLSPCSGWFHSICLRMTHCQTINGLFCGIKRVDVSFDGGKSWVEASRCHKLGSLMFQMMRV
ncbi:hypothetical protein G4B88_018048 [Cannabis sativa]|uniref:Uncharacterized protein n=1 Tax=Cannabis sativa TaxID=3483 RepID=A0A7J6E9Q5_CANSA|nr:hypothetical protein G4B88_018048 [Cannabis sativa]